MKNSPFFAIFCHTLLHRSYIPNLVNIGQQLRIFTFGGSKKAFKKSEKCEKNDFFQKSKKCQFLPTSRSYIPSFIWISPKLRPAASGQTDKQTDRHVTRGDINETPSHISSANK